LDAAVTFDSQPKRGLMRFEAILQRLLHLRQDLLGQLQQNFALRSKTQRLAFAYK